MRYILFLFFIHSLHSQCLDGHLYADHSRQTLIATHVDSFDRLNDYVFYRKANRLYSYSLQSGVSSFIDWNINHFSIGPDDTLAYKKGNSFYIKAAPYSGKSTHIAWNVSDYFWTVDGTLVFNKLNSYYILHNKFLDKPVIVSANISQWIKGCSGKLAYIKLGNLYFIDNKVTGSKINVQANIDKAFFIKDSLYFMKNGDLWHYSTANNIKSKILYRVRNYYVCGEYLYVHTQRGLFVVKDGVANFTGHSNITGIRTSLNGISYIYRGRLYYVNGKNVVELCQSPGWYGFSKSGSLFLYRNNNLCFLDEKYKVHVLLEGVYSPRLINNRIYYTQKSRRYYLEPALGKITLCK